MNRAIFSFLLLTAACSGASGVEIPGAGRDRNDLDPVPSGWAESQRLQSANDDGGSPVATEDAGSDAAAKPDVTEPDATAPDAPSGPTEGEILQCKIAACGEAQVQCGPAPGRHCFGQPVNCDDVYGKCPTVCGGGGRPGMCGTQCVNGQKNGICANSPVGNSWAGSLGCTTLVRTDVSGNVTATRFVDGSCIEFGGAICCP